MDKREYFDSLASDWDNYAQSKDATAKRAQFVTLATEAGPSRILDVGCGTGVLVPALLGQCPSATIVELDISAQMIARNRAKNNRANIQFLCSSLSEAPLEPESFDAILCFNALPHFDIEKALAKSAELLKPGGRIAIGHLICSDELNAFHSLLDAPVAQDRLPAAGELSKMLSRTALTVLRCEERPDWYFVLAEKPPKRCETPFGG